MSLRRTIRPHAVALYLGPGLLRLQRAARRWGRRRLDFVHQVDDPYCHLLAQTLPALVDAAGFELTIHLVAGPDSSFTPDSARLRGWALRDAVCLAEERGLSFPAGAVLPESGAVAAAQTEAVGADLDALIGIGERLFSGGFQGASGGGPDLSSGAAALARLGHYQAGMLHYEGEWYWGVDRLGFLEERLREEGIVVPERAEGRVDVGGAGAGETLEFFFSFRSPYSYLAVEPILKLVAERDLPLRIRPVLPMVMRGLSVPKAKVLYIARDCARLARAQGTPYGRIADPLGPGIERCLALFSVAGADEQAPLVRSISRGVWSEGLDVTHEPHLRLLVERSGMAWPATLDIDGGLAMAEANRQALLELGLWGVPSFRFGEKTAWGQDRIARVRGWLRG